MPNIPASVSCMNCTRPHGGRRSATLKIKTRAPVKKTQPPDSVTHELQTQCNTLRLAQSHKRRKIASKAPIPAPVTRAHTTGDAIVKQPPLSRSARILRAKHIKHARVEFNRTKLEPGTRP